MKNLVKAIETEQKNRLNDFIFEINQLTEVKQLATWQYNDLLPNGKKMNSFSFQSYKAYLIGRKEKAIYKAIEREVNKINTVANSGELISVKISVEWKRSQMWGSNPNAECWVYFINKDGNFDSHYFTSGSIGGCGYDKLSTAIANVLNQSNEVLKLLYTIKDGSEIIDNRKGNHTLFGYGAGYGILPNIEGGVGVSCYNAIFNKIGFELKSVASGKTFDVFEITKAN